MNQIEGDKRPVFTLTARGHPALRATHRTTLELTKDAHLTTRGDCIIGVSATVACADLPDPLRAVIQGGKNIHVRLQAGPASDEFRGEGSPELTLAHNHDMVFRKSSFACPRTVLVNCTKTACELDRRLIEVLRNPEATLTITFEVVD